MAMPGREYQAGSSEYRYGFNGKEKSDEVYGEGNVYDYGFRIYNPRLGKFLSVDPLMQSYPWYTPYQYAGNKPIQFIDLDGLEELDPIVAIQEPKSKGEPGLAYTTARKIYYVVTTGAGALTTDQQSKINVNKINTQLNSTPNQPALFTDLKLKTTLNISKRTYENLTSSNENKKSRALAQITDPFYIVNLTFDTDVRVVEDMSLEKIAILMQSNPSLYGAIFNIISPEDISKLSIPSAIADLNNEAKSQFDTHSGSRDGEAEGYGSILSGTNTKGFDVVIINSNNSNLTLDMTDLIIHEYGHNSTNNAHSDEYHYKQTGLQSRDPGYIVPNGENKTRIIGTSNTSDLYDKIVYKKPDGA